MLVVLGAFGYSNNQLDGQTVKTRNVYNLLCDRQDEPVNKIDTVDFKKKPWLLIKLLYYLVKCKTVVIVPCLNNLTFIFPLAYLLSKIISFDIISICVGGWQVEYFLGNERFKPHPLQLKYSRKIKGFLPEMENVNRVLIQQLSFKNTEVFPNFRRFRPVQVNTTVHNELKMVFMARINKTKGYNSIFLALDKLKNLSENVSMTFYGQVAEENKAEFDSLIKAHSDFASFKGALKPEEIQQTLTQYDVMLLPTQYYTEGFPGSILDAYIAGIPVIVTEWKHSHEFVDDGNTGFIVPFGECVDDIVECIRMLIRDKNLLNRMKNNAQKESLKYSEDKAWDVIRKYL